eukprot:TRINITY_DN1404_c0_g1_i4.p1 TRINITY_DN1404_c0_g1~~TRINITY_DN1404_c0_g1_i4.p1  ORF type:complete len:262 (-),score=41.05 TRINITY_DN1404_c0_g1_i4:243-1028(-)
MSCCPNCVFHNPKFIIKCEICNQPIKFDDTPTNCENCKSVKITFLSHFTSHNAINNNTENEGGEPSSKRSLENETTQQQPLKKISKLIDNNSNDDVVRAPIDGTLNIFSQLFISGGLFSNLTMDSALNLALASSTLFKILRPYIIDKYFFRYEDRRFQFYSPQYLLVSSEVKNYPPIVKHIQFDNNYNFPVVGLPLTVTHLRLGENFSQSLYTLPSSITHLTLGNDNYPKDLIKQTLPNLVYFECVFSGIFFILEFRILKL